MDRVASVSASAWGYDTAGEGAASASLNVRLNHDPKGGQFQRDDQRKRAGSRNSPDQIPETRSNTGARGLRVTQDQSRERHPFGGRKVIDGLHALEAARKISFPRFPGTEEEIRARGLLNQRLQEIGYAVEEQPFFYDDSRPEFV